MPPKLALPVPCPLVPTTPGELNPEIIMFRNKVLIHDQLGQWPMAEAGQEHRRHRTGLFPLPTPSPPSLEQANPWMTGLVEGVDKKGATY